MINLKRIKRIPNKIKKCILNPETIFNIKHNSGLVVDLNEWQNVKPDYLISSYENIECDSKFKKISQILHLEKRILLSIREMWNIYNWIIKTEKISGDIAEVGTYKGGSAKLICEIKKKKFYVFDTFEGLPETNSNDKSMKKGDFAESLESVKSYLSKYEDTYFCKGIFPESAKQLENKLTKFSFVHLDLDIYSSTLNSLEYFYPRLSTGGVILTHDYRCVHCPGVKKAFDEFFTDKPETIVELWDTQALIIKI